MKVNAIIAENKINRAALNFISTTVLNRPAMVKKEFSGTNEVMFKRFEVFSSTLQGHKVLIRVAEIQYQLGLNVRKGVYTASQNIDGKSRRHKVKLRWKLDAKLDTIYGLKQYMEKNKSRMQHFLSLLHYSKLGVGAVGWAKPFRQMMNDIYTFRRDRGLRHTGVTPINEPYLLLKKKVVDDIKDRGLRMKQQPASLCKAIRAGIKLNPLFKTCGLTFGHKYKIALENVVKKLKSKGNEARNALKRERRSWLFKFNKVLPQIREAGALKLNLTDNLERHLRLMLYNREDKEHEYRSRIKGLRDSVLMDLMIKLTGRARQDIDYLGKYLRLKEKLSTSQVKEFDAHPYRDELIAKYGEPLEYTKMKMKLAAEAKEKAKVEEYERQREAIRERERLASLERERARAQGGGPADLSRVPPKLTVNRELELKIKYFEGITEEEVVEELGEHYKYLKNVISRSPDGNLSVKSSTYDFLKANRRNRSLLACLARIYSGEN